MFIVLNIIVINMVRLLLIVFVALQIFLIKSFPTDVDGSPQTANSSQTDVRDTKYDSEVENTERERGEYKEEENLGNSHMFEGDIYKDKSTTRILNVLLYGATSGGHRVTRDAVVNPRRLWPKGRVPYVFGRVNSLVKSAFRQAIAEYNKHTCIRIVPRTTEKDYLYIISYAGCWSAISKSGGKQSLSLGRGCERKGTAVHEIMHALGFFHEHTRHDRDKYITIRWRHIRWGEEYNFQTYPRGTADPMNEPYDYDSIMHYPKDAFTRYGWATIVPKKAGVTIGQRTRLSRIDIRQINKLYKCGNFAVPTTPTPKPTTPPCVDQITWCDKWVKSRYCVDGPCVMYMKEVCKKSCGFCSNAGISFDSLNDYGSITHYSKDAVSRNGSCVDQKPWCKKWAKSNYCVKGPCMQYMREVCKKTCGVCGVVVTPKCVDVKSKCVKWAKLGFCGNYPDYMKKYCAKTCRKC